MRRAIAIATTGLALFAAACEGPVVNEPQDVSPPPITTPTESQQPDTSTADEPELVECLDEEGDEGVLITEEIVDMAREDARAEGTEDPPWFDADAFYDLFVGVCIVPEKWNAAVDELNRSFEEADLLASPTTPATQAQAQQASLQPEVRRAEITDRYESDICFGQETCYEEADAGNVFVLVDLLVRNTGSEAENFSELLQVDLADREGILLGSPTLAFGLEGAFQGGTLGTGQAAAGLLVWEVPEGSCPCVMRVNVGNLFTPNYIQFNLNTPG